MTQSLHQAMQRFHPQLPLGVALSGGADSTALLVLCARQWPGKVHALHINHGLQPAAASFEAHCRQVCAALDVPLRSLRVQAAHGPGQSPEDAARIARYQGLLQLSGAGPDGPALDAIALAQHADDQVETLLLALSRGAGLAGLSAMPAHWRRGGMSFHRPLLRVAGADIRAWLQGQGVEHVEDPSNRDARYTRNRIRLHLLPALEAVFPQFRDTFARSAAHAAQAQDLLEQIGAQDLAPLLRQSDGLPLIGGLQQLAPARQANALRHWLKTGYGVIPSAAQLQELQRLLAGCRTRGHHVHLKVGEGFVERRGAVLAWYNARVLPHRN